MKKMRQRALSGTKNPEISERERRNFEVARYAAAQGMVLLKNEGVLPLAPGTKAALYGGGSVRTIKGGTGSGDVNERASVGVYEGLIGAGVDLTNREWLEKYGAVCRKAREDWRDSILEEVRKNPDKNFIEVYSTRIFRTPAGDPICAADVEKADVALYVVSRTAGEDADRYLDAGDYYLTEREKEELAILNAHCEKIVVLINTGGAMDLKDILALPHVKGLLVISQPGMAGGCAVADVLTGKVSPGGKLTATWPVSYEDIPGAMDYSHNNGDISKDYYREGLYVGYRYFDSFEKETAFPFGYGLSYTTFSIGGCSVSAEDAGGVTVRATVANTGNTHAGREVVEVYVSCPQTKLPKVYRSLCGFQKTGLLAPGEKEEVTIRIPARAFASFSEEEAAWIVEKGQYALWIGNSSASLALIGVLAVDGDVCLEKTAHILPLSEKLEELSCPEEIRLRQENAWKELAARRGLTPIPYAPGEQKREGRPAVEAEALAERIAGELTEEQLIAMVIGEVSKGQGQVLGAAGIKVPGAAGETSGCLEEAYGVPGVPMADGPAGLRLNKTYDVDRATGSVDTHGFLGALEGGLFAEHSCGSDVDVYYQYATAIPVGTLLAQSWDPELLTKVGSAVAEEMEEFGIGWWLAPGMNIQKNPLCGRNFEYYSEDPLLSGAMAAAMTRGVQSGKGVGTTIKHFACNNQEDNRMGCDSIVSERALREIYLRGFEIAVKTAQPMAIMTSYNLINGVHTANSYDLCTEAARKEWGFAGIIMTDWTTTSPRGGSVSWACVHAGNDLIMPGSEADGANIRAALADGRLSADDLRGCVRRLLTVILQTNAYEDAVPYGERFA